jgi:hypothetical protein
MVIFLAGGKLDIFKSVRVFFKSPLENDKSLRLDDGRFVFSHLLNAELDGSLSVWVPLAHHGEYLRNARLRIDKHLQTFQAAQVEIGSIRQLTLCAEWSLRRRMGHWIRSRLIRLRI